MTFHTFSWVKQLEWYIGNEFTTKGSTVKLHAYRVGDHNTNGLSWAFALRNHSRASEIDIIFLQVAVQSDSCKNIEHLKHFIVPIICCISIKC